MTPDRTTPSDRPTTGGLPDLPDDVAAKVEFDEQYEVQDHHIVAVFLRADAPYRSVGQVAAELDMSKQGVRNRLATLEELAVLDSAPGANGRIYWLRDERSDWPIPPDVEVTPVDDDLTVPELWSRRHVKLATLSTGLGLFCTISVMLLVVVYQVARSLDALVFALSLLVLLLGAGSLGTGAVAFVDLIRYRW